MKHACGPATPVGHLSCLVSIKQEVPQDVCVLAFGK
jgi:hypothetical protein